MSPSPTMWLADVLLIVFERNRNGALWRRVNQASKTDNVCLSSVHSYFSEDLLTIRTVEYCFVLLKSAEMSPAVGLILLILFSF